MFYAPENTSTQFGSELMTFSIIYILISWNTMPYKKLKKMSSFAQRAKNLYKKINCC